LQPLCSNKNNPDPKMASKDPYMDAFIRALGAVGHPPQPEYKGIPEDMKSLMPIFITTKIAKDKVEERNPTAALAADILSFLRADNIPLHLIHCYFPHKTESEMHDAMILLDKYALLQYNKTKKIITAHRSVQEVLLESLKFHRRILLTFTYFIRLSMIILKQEVAHPDFRNFVYQILKSTEYMTAITNEEDHTKFKIMLADLILDDDCLEWTAGRLLKEAYDETKKRHGQCHSEALLLRVRMAHLKTNKKEYEEAKGILEEVLTKQIGKFGEDNRDVYKTQVTMGRLFAKEGLFDEGIDLLKEVLEKQLKVFGKKDRDSVRTKKIIEDLVADKEWQDQYEKEQEDAELEKGMKELMTEKEKDDAADAGAEGEKK